MAGNSGTVAVVAIVLMVSLIFLSVLSLEALDLSVELLQAIKVMVNIGSKIFLYIVNFLLTKVQGILVDSSPVILFGDIILVTSKRINFFFMDQRIINLYDEYTHKPLTRKDFFHRLTLLTGSSAAAMTVLPLLEVNYSK